MQAQVLSLISSSASSKWKFMLPVTQGSQDYGLYKLVVFSHACWFDCVYVLICTAVTPECTVGLGICSQQRNMLFEGVYVMERDCCSWQKPFSQTWHSTFPEVIIAGSETPLFQRNYRCLKGKVWNRAGVPNEIVTRLSTSERTLSG